MHSETIATVAGMAATSGTTAAFAQARPSPTNATPTFACLETALSRQMVKTTVALHWVSPYGQQVERVGPVSQVFD